MNILYRQAKGGTLRTSSNEYNVSNCFFKAIEFDADKKDTTEKMHYHTSFELHMITEGYQEYIINDKSYRINQGEFILMAPGCLHRSKEYSQNAKKFSSTFNMAQRTPVDFFKGEVTSRMKENTEFIIAESASDKESSRTLVENSVFETLVLALRQGRISEREASEVYEENSLFFSAKKFILENIEKNPDVITVSKRMNISSRQLARIFNKNLGVTVGEYIRNQRIRRLEELLTETSLSLREISEKMNFTNEYNFHSYFKKYAGMPPGAFRKMIKK